VTAKYRIREDTVSKIMRREMWLLAISAAVLIAVAVACSSEPETIVVEKEVVKEVQVPGELATYALIRATQLPSDG
jgi:hypothetical protein